MLQVAFPMVVSSMSWTLMTYVDRALLAHHDPNEMAASFSAGIVWFALFCLFFGTSSYVGTFVSQYHGDEQPEKIGPVVWQGNWLSLWSIPLAVAAYAACRWVFELADHSQVVTEMEIKYFQILCYAGPGLVLGQSFSSFYSGRGITWVVMLVDLFATIVNLGLDYLWIFGKWGFPDAGIAGAAWATVLACWLKPVIYLVLLNHPQHRTSFRSFDWKLEWAIFKRLVYFGGPSGVQMLLDVTGFAIFVLLIGRLGEMESQASTMAFSINTVSFMPAWGLGVAASILVGQRLGENRDDLANRATWTCYQIGMAYMVLLTVLYVALPNLFISNFLGNESLPTAEKEALQHMALILLYFVAAYNAFDSTQILFVSALKGAGDSRFIMLVSLVMATALAVLTYVAVEILHADVYACWVLIVLWLIALAVTYLARFIGGKWRNMRVIEQVHHPQPAEN